MKHALLACVVCLVAAPPGEGGSQKEYPRFNLGVTGINAKIENKRTVIVEGTDPGTPAAGKLEKGDIIVAAGGKVLEGDDLRVPLGEAIGAAEARDGRLVLKVKRGGRERLVTITLPVLGAYSRTWPRDCRKSKAIIRTTAEFIVKTQQQDGGYKLASRPERDGLSGCLTGLFLLSTGEERYLTNVRRQVRALAAKVKERPTGSSWHLGYQGILLAEYYLKTGDSSVLGGLKALCDQAAKTQAAGAWGHGAGVNPGYVQSGLMNSAGVTVFVALVLARECGVAVSETAYTRALRFFYRMAGHGCICYGDHRSELFPNTNGRNGAIACGLSLLDQRSTRMAAQHLALLMADSYYAPEFGHTGGGFNVIWRGMATVHVPADRQSHYRRQMDKLAWYYDLCRLPGGGFSLLPSPPSTTRYCGVVWGTGAIGLTYTAPLKTLRITGAPRTKHSVKTKNPEIPWGRAADLEFLRTDDCEGFGKEDTEPHVVQARLRGRGDVPVDFCAKMMRHFSPMVRTWAARKLADKADEASINAIVKALEHPDARVRRAAFDGISGYDNWGRPTSPGRQRGKIPPPVVSARCLPAILKALKNPNAAWWEIDGALWALGRALPADIRNNMALIKRFAAHEDWYVREATFWSVVGLHKEITGAEFRFLADHYAKSRHVFARSSYDAGMRFLLQGDKVKLDAASEAAVVRSLGATLHSARVVEGYGTTGKHEAAHRTMMILKYFNPSVFKLILDDLVKYLETWTPDYQHSWWLITGSNWQPGLVKVAAQLGRDARPLIAAFRKCLAEKIKKGSRDKAHVECGEKLEKAIREFESKYGR
jgi:hypothetical protein